MKMVNFAEFFRYLTASDKALMVIGTASAIICGCLLPALGIVMGSVTNTFGDSDPAAIKSQMQTIVGWICLVGLGCWVFGYIYYAFWQHMAENITFNLRSRYLKAIMK